MSTCELNCETGVALCAHLSMAKMSKLIHQAGRVAAMPLRASLVMKRINLVDPASSHMLVSKIKPCMSQYKLLYRETANGSLKQLSFIWWSFITWITVVILELIHAPKPDFEEGLCLLVTEPTQVSAWSSGDS